MTERKQKTKPRKGDPIEIPIPERKDFEDVLDRAAEGDKPRVRDRLKKAAKDSIVRRTSTSK